MIKIQASWRRLGVICWVLLVWGSGESAAGYQWNLHHLNQFLLCAHADTFHSQDGLPLQAGSSGFTHPFGARFKCTEMQDFLSFWRAEPAMLSCLIYWHLLIWVMLIGLAPHALPSSDCHVFLYTFSPSCPWFCTVGNFQERLCHTKADLTAFLRTTDKTCVILQGWGWGQGLWASSRDRPKGSGRDQAPDFKLFPFGAT